MITQLKLRNFKSIQGDEVIFKPLTIFTGPNSSGKSNLIESMAILSQIAKLSSTGRITFQQTLENEKAEYFKYPVPSIEYVVYKGETEREVTIELHLSSNISKRSIGYSAGYCSEKEMTEQKMFLGPNPIFYAASSPLKGFDQSIIEHPNTWKGKQSAASASFLLLKESFIALDTVVEKAKQNVDLRFRSLAQELVDELRKELNKIFLISAPRGMIPIKTAPGQDVEWVGKNGENLIMILSKIYGQRKFKSIQQKISSWSERFGIGNIAAGVRKGAYLGADFEDPSLKTDFDLSSASYGSRQLLTLITQIFWSEKGSSLMIEEPELSLHPDSQMLILELFSEAVKDGKQIICTTHSPFFILSLSKVIGEESLSKENVAIYHVEKGENGTKTRRLELNDHGFVKGWIPSYIQGENTLFNEWAKSLE